MQQRFWGLEEQKQFLEILNLLLPYGNQLSSRWDKNKEFKGICKKQAGEGTHEMLYSLLYPYFINVWECDGGVRDWISAPIFLSYIDDSFMSELYACVDNLLPTPLLHQASIVKDLPMIGGVVTDQLHRWITYGLSHRSTVRKRIEDNFEEWKCAKPQLDLLESFNNLDPQHKTLPQVNFYFVLLWTKVVTLCGGLTPKILQEFRTKVTKSMGPFIQRFLDKERKFNQDKNLRIKRYCMINHRLQDIVIDYATEFVDIEDFIYEILLEAEPKKKAKATKREYAVGAGPLTKL